MPLLPGSRIRSDWYRYSSLGMQFALTIGVFAFAGYWLDQKLGTGPWLLIALVFLGFFGGLLSMVAKVSKLGTAGKGKPRDRTDDSEREPPRQP
ncbi:MAG: AtpZ/AtpI family protein [Planctomycetota bacterium]